MKLPKIISLITVFIIFNVIYLFLTIDEVSAAQIHCKLPSGEITEMYKSECKSKEGVVVDIEEVAIGDKKKSKTSDLIKRLKSKTLWSMITGKESAKKEDKPKKKSLWSMIKGEENIDEEKLKQKEEESLKKEEEQRLLTQKKSEEKIEAEEVAKSENKKSLWVMIKSLMKGKKD
jgi:hypothetical protein